MNTLKSVWGWFVGALALAAIAFAVSNAKRAGSRKRAAEKDIEYLEANRSGTMHAAKQAEVAHARVAKEAKKVETIKAKTQQRIERVQARGSSSADIDALLDQLNSL